MIAVIAGWAEALLHGRPKQGASGPVLCVDFRGLSWVSTKFVLTLEQMFPLNFSEPQTVINLQQILVSNTASHLASQSKTGGISANLRMENLEERREM